MQSTARKLDYVEYDLARFDRRQRVKEALKREPVAVPGTVRKTQAAKAERTDARATAVAARRFRVSAFAVVGYLAVTALMIFIVYNYMQLNELTLKTAGLQSQYQKLQDEAAVLQVQYEQKTNLRELESRAAELGMSRPVADQITYVNLSEPDRAVILRDTGRNSDFLSGITALLSAVVDFMR